LPASLSALPAWTLDELLAIEPPEEEMFRLEWDPRVLTLYQRDDGVINPHIQSAQSRFGFAGYAQPIIRNFRAEGLHLIGILTFDLSRRLTCTQTSSTHRLRGCNMAHMLVRIPTLISMHSEIRTDGQTGVKPRTIVNDRYCAITLSCNPELW